MTEKKTPETIVDADLEAVKGAGSAVRGQKSSKVLDATLGSGIEGDSKVLDATQGSGIADRGKSDMKVLDATQGAGLIRR